MRKGELLRSGNLLRRKHQGMHTTELIPWKGSHMGWRVSRSLETAWMPKADLADHLAGQEGLETAWAESSPHWGTLAGALADHTRIHHHISQLLSGTLINQPGNQQPGKERSQYHTDGFYVRYNAHVM
jgi:hypothetical protein